MAIFTFAYLLLDLAMIRLSAYIEFGWKSLGTLLSRRRTRARVVPCTCELPFRSTSRAYLYHIAAVFERTTPLGLRWLYLYKLYAVDNAFHHHFAQNAFSRGLNTLQ